MKFLIALFLFFSNVSYTQSLAENKVDEFTKNNVKRTTWETLTKTTTLITHSRISKVDDVIFLSLKIMGPNKVFSINEGAELMFKTEKDSIVTLKCIKYMLSCTGCGAVGFSGSGYPGIDVDYLLKKEQVDFLLKNRIKKIRIYTSDGYLEEDVKEKSTQTFIKELELIK